MSWEPFSAMVLIGLGLDLAIGWPAWLYARIGHPVTWIGGLIDALERRLNNDTIFRGAVLVLGVVLAATLPALAVQVLLPAGPLGWILGGVLTWPLIAAHSLDEHVARVAQPLTEGDLDGAREAVSMIVGRDPNALAEPGIARAAMESLAENTSDGVVAPIFWGVLAGLPGIAAYKAINTLDSMIGHRNARYERFGKVAARLDDLVNLIPARLTGLLFSLVSGRFWASVRVMLRDARFHRSPNAGWPESAVAGALGVRLSGPRAYGDAVSDEPWLNPGAADPTPEDLHRALSLYRRLVVVATAALLALTWL